MNQQQSQQVGIINDWTYVYKQYIPSSVYSDLTVYIPDEGNSDQLVPFSVFDCSDPNIVAIPRYCNYSLQLLYNGMLIDGRNSGAAIDIDINVQPRDHYQVDAINAILSNDHGILCAKTAFGKTYVAIHCIAKLKTKALILMHKRDLMYQWKNDIIKYTNLTEDDIQIFTGSKFDKDKAITITTVQNIAAKIRMEQLSIRQKFMEANFGITFFDECHTTIGPLSNSLASRWIFSKRLYGLSATPKRGDDLDKVINFLVGDVIYTDNRKMIPVYTCFAPVHVDVPGNIKYWLRKNLKQYTINYNKWLKNQEPYVKYCANMIVSLIQKNRKILAVAAYKNLLNAVYEETYSILGDKSLSVDKIRMIHGTSELGLSTIKDMTEEDIDNFNCIFSTNKFFSDGISIDWLDTIVYLTPPSSKSLSAIPQLVGRIVRDYKGKKYVIVVDIVNSGFDIEVARANKRRTAYNNLKYKELSLSDSLVTTDAMVDTMISTIESTTKNNQIMIPFTNINKVIGA